MESTRMNIRFQEHSRPPAVRHHPVLRFIGHLLSFVLHPLFIPAYITAFLLYVHPYAFAGLDEKKKLLKFGMVVFSTAFLPAFSVFLLKQLKFIDSIFLRSQKDRIIPYMICMIFYFWVWYVSKNLRDGPEMVSMLLGTFIASIAGLMANIYFKISMHGIAAGLLFVFFVWLAFTGTVSLGGWLAAATLITGIICTARFLVSDHNPFEIYAGLLAGALCELIAIGIAG